MGVGLVLYAHTMFYFVINAMNTTERKQLLTKALNCSLAHKQECSFIIYSKQCVVSCQVKTTMSLKILCNLACVSVRTTVNTQPVGEM